MSEHNKNFYSLEELKRARDCYEGYQDGEEVYYFVGALRYACDEIERLEKENERYRIAINEMAITMTKAIEYIENEMPCLWEVDDVWEDINGNYQHNYKEYDTQILLNKLKGVDKE